MIKTADYKLPFIFIPLAAILMIMIYLFMFRYFSQIKQEVLDSYVEVLRNEYEITVNTYSKTADLIFETIVNTEDIKKLFAEGVSAENQETADKYRADLYERLAGFYDILQKYNFRQLHFHDEQNRSFLRFHRPDRYGDDLTGVRASVEYVNDYHEKTSGFEEGRIYNGYRYVYPLNWRDRHTGSVEISISVKTIIEQMETTYGKKAQFILLKKQMSEKVFESEQSNYLPWSVDPRYVLDRNINSSCIFESNLSPADSGRISRMLDEYGADGIPFSLEAVYAYTDSVISFLPVMNFLDEPIAYLIAVSDSTKILEAGESFRIVTIMYFTLFTVVLLLAVYYVYTRKKIERILMTDQITQIDSRQVLLEKMDDEKNRFLRYGHPFTIIMLDIDHFKRVNDTYGHLKGDHVLRLLSRVLKDHIRDTDRLGRYGGEEFIIVLPETVLEASVAVAENLRKKIENTGFLESEKVTVSMGLAESRSGMKHIDELIEAADKNLYKAKAAGRNCIRY